MAFSIKHAFTLASIVFLSFLGHTDCFNTMATSKRLTHRKTQHALYGTKEAGKEQMDKECFKEECGLLAITIEDCSIEGDVDPRQCLFHTHFGAGRLGLGLVAPAIERSGVPYCVVQRPKTTWKAISKTGSGSALAITVNGEPVVKEMKVALGDLEAADYIGAQSLALLGSNLEVLKDLTQQSTSFSCALGSAAKKVLVPLMMELPVRGPGKRPILYACENDHGMVDIISKQLEGRVDVISCMVDRICTGRTIEANRIDIQAEPFGGSIVLLDPPNRGHIVPLGGESVTVPSSKAEAEFFYERKLFLVNGMHTTLAFLTLSLANPSGTEAGDHLLRDYTNSTRRQRRIIWAWAMARCLMLIENHGMETIAGALGYRPDQEEEIFDDLIQFADKTLRRFSTVQDKTSRVLGGGVASRWASRLRPVKTFLSDNPAINGSPDAKAQMYARFLKRAEVDETRLRAYVNDLCADTARFTRKDVGSVVADLVDFYDKGKKAAKLTGFKDYNTGLASDKIKQKDEGDKLQSELRSILEWGLESKTITQEQQDALLAEMERRYSSVAAPPA
mmetsp:Transcript_41194/g.60723  ORF Transcript_41194/g.60723 Transcript_41194/m.60723 type:complete len:563 (+) Transcript_41194:82-1770(+)